MQDYKNSEMFNLIDEWIHNARDRRIMKDRLINGASVEAIAEKYELSVSQARRIVDNNKTILFSHLE